MTRSWGTCTEGVHCQKQSWSVPVSHSSILCKAPVEWERQKYIILLGPLKLDSCGLVRTESTQEGELGSWQRYSLVIAKHSFLPQFTLAGAFLEMWDMSETVRAELCHLWQSVLSLKTKPVFQPYCQIQDKWNHLLDATTTTFLKRKFLP